MPVWQNIGSMCLSQIPIEIPMEIPIEIPMEIPMEKPMEIPMEIPIEEILSSVFCKTWFHPVQSVTQGDDRLFHFSQHIILTAAAGKSLQF